MNKDFIFKDIFKFGRRWHTSSFVAYYKQSSGLDLAFVASKKIGNAVQRNLAKRRLRALALAHHTDQKILTGHFVFVAKEGILTANFAELSKDFSKAIAKIQRP